MNSETDVVKVLKDDGLEDISWEQLEKYQNATTTNLDELRTEFGAYNSWAVRIAYNDTFGGVGGIPIPLLLLTGQLSAVEP